MFGVLVINSSIIILLSFPDRKEVYILHLHVVTVSVTHLSLSEISLIFIQFTMNGVHDRHMYIICPDMLSMGIETF
jgi:hypothetical protein